MSDTSLSLNVVTSGQTPAQGMSDWNSNFESVQDAWNDHITNTAAHQANTADGGMVFEDLTQTLTNKVISYTSGNNIIITTSGISGDVVNFRTLEYPKPTVGDDDDVDWGIGYDSTAETNEVILLSGLNGLEVRHTVATNDLNVMVPENFVINSGTQTLHINTPYASDSQTLKVGGAGTFTNTLTVAAGGINIDAGGLDVTAGGITVTAGAIDQNDSTDSTSGSTGSINTAGGLGVTKKLYAGDNITQPASKSIIGGSNGTLTLQDASGNSTFVNSVGTAYFDAYNVSLRAFNDTTKYITVGNDGNLTVNLNLKPGTNDSFDIGNSSHKWNDIFLSGHVYVDDNKYFYSGPTGEGLMLGHSGANSFLTFDGGPSNVGYFAVRDNANNVSAKFEQSAGASLYYNGSVKLATTNTGATVTGVLSATSFSGDIAGNATSADKWTTARTLTLTGDATGSGSWDGSGNATLSVTIDGAQHSHDTMYYTETESDNRYLRKDTNTTLQGQLTINTSATAAALADTFDSETTKQNKIYFTDAASSNDNGQIVHETCSSTGYTNMGVLHLCPSDDATDAGTDYVSIHGSNDPEHIKLHTGGKIETTGDIYADRFYGGSGGPVPYLVYYMREGTHSFSATNVGGYYQVENIKIPESGVYRFNASIMTEYGGEGYHGVRIEARVGDTFNSGTVIGYYRARTYYNNDHSTDWTGAMFGTRHLTSDSSTNLWFKIVDLWNNEDDLDRCEVRSCSLEWIGSGNSDFIIS